MTQLIPAVARRLERLPKGLRDHVQRSRNVAREFAERYGVCRDRIDMAMAAHDLARSLGPKALLAQADHLNLDVDPVEAHTPILLHGPIAARWLENENGLDDKQILEAVHYHTTGIKGMSKLAKIVFLADKLDPYKVANKGHMKLVAELATDSLDAALLEYMDRKLMHLIGRGALVHPRSLELRNELTVAVRRTS
jgi:predicted HD superfamily hydrolase involved in NAD metabolism